MTAPVSSMRVLVFGRNGQVAQALADHAGPGWAFMGRNEIDVSDGRSVSDAVGNSTWDAVINASAYTAVDRAESEESAATTLNAIAPGSMAGACAGGGIPFVHISTDYVFDGEKKTPYGEDDAVNPLNVYGRTKREGERLVLAAGGKAVILRTSWVYAPEGQNFVGTMLRLGQERDELRIVADQTGAPTAASDIANGIVSILSQEIRPGIYHMTGSGETSWYGFASEIFRLARLKGLRTPRNVVPITTAEYPTPAKRPLNSRLNCEKLANIYGIRLPQWQESLARHMDIVLPDAAGREVLAR